MRTLIVGGPHDGEWHDVDIRREQWRIPVRSAMPDMAFAETVPEVSDAKIATYTRRRWRCRPDEEWFIFAPLELSDGMVMDHLLSGYRRP